MSSTPRFRVDKEVKPPKVYLQCSICEKDIREVQMEETIDVRKGYYCEEHDDGAIHLNLPTDEE